MLFQTVADISKSKIFLIFCLVFIFGIAIASFLPAVISGFAIEFFGAGIFFAVLTILFWRSDGKACLMFLFVSILFLSVWRYAISLPSDAIDKIRHYNGQTVTARGFVSNEPDIRETSQKLEITVNAINEFPGRVISGKILATTNLYPEYKYGDRMEMRCELEKPERFQGFAYDNYLARYDIYSVCYYPELKIIPGRGGNIVYSKIFSLKNKLSGLIDMGLSEPESSLARPIVFGGQKGLDRESRDNFQRAGLTHIMAVSGFNVSILSAVFMAVLLSLGLSRKTAFYAAVALLAAYIVLVGLPASAMRAGFMCFLVLWALKLGRLNKITNSLVFAASIMIFANPKILRDDAGFQLSFLAMAGLIYVYPILCALWEKMRLPRIKGISHALLMTLAAQIFTLPVLAYDFSGISLIAPIANLAVVWILPILTILILSALLLSFVFPLLSPVFFLPCLILTRYILKVAEYAAKIPRGYFEVGYLWIGWVALYYCALIFAVAKLRRMKSRNNALPAME